MRKLDPRAGHAGLHAASAAAGSWPDGEHLCVAHRPFSSSEAQALYEETYLHEPLVQVLPAGQQATLKHVVKKNGAAISLTPVAPDLLHVTSVTDNLRKGASAQAIQCFNLMVGLPETMGLL